MLELPLRKSCCSELGQTIPLIRYDRPQQLWRLSRSASIPTWIPEAYISSRLHAGLFSSSTHACVEVCACTSVLVRVSAAAPLSLPPGHHPVGAAGQLPVIQVSGAFNHHIEPQLPDITGEVIMKPMS